MNYPPEYNKYSDTVAEEILRNDSLSDDGKLMRLVEHYKNRLLSTGSLAEQVNRQEKKINEEIRYAEEKIVTAFKYYKSSYENEPAFHISMQPIRLQQQALSIALAAIKILSDAETKSFPIEPSGIKLDAIISRNRYFNSSILETSVD